MASSEELLLRGKSWLDIATLYTSKLQSHCVQEPAQANTHTSPDMWSIFRANKSWLWS